MVLISVLSLAMAAVPRPALRPVDDQAYLALLAETKFGRMAGMPPIDLSQIPAGIKLPAEAMMFSGSPVRILNVRLWSPTIAPASATAEITPPSGLKQGDKLVLDLYRPEANATGSDGPKNFNPDANPEEFTIKLYWGSSETVREGQPRIIKWGGLSEEQKEAMKDQARRASAANSYFYRPGWTTGYWPTPRQAGNIDKTASLVGKYSLATNYTGNVDIEAPSNVDFLAPIALTEPNLDAKLDLKKALGFKWTPIPNALGLIAGAMGMEGKNTVIIWTSSEVPTENLIGDTGFLQMADVLSRVDKGEFLKGDASTVTIPAGIFANADMAMLNMAGYGPGAALEKAQPLPRIQTKTSLMVILGGKQMRR